MILNRLLRCSEILPNWRRIFNSVSTPKQRKTKSRNLDSQIKYHEFICSPSKFAARIRNQRKEWRSLKIKTQVCGSKTYLRFCNRLLNNYSRLVLNSSIKCSETIQKVKKRKIKNKSCIRFAGFGFWSSSSYFIGLLLAWKIGPINWE